MKLKFNEVKDEGLKLDLGCGKGTNTPEGFEKIDLVKSPGVKVVDLRKKWPWKNGEVGEISATNLIQYLKPQERIHFVNEAHRVLKQGGKCVIIAPHWCTSKAYGDMAAHYPPISEAWFMLLNKNFRDQQSFATDGYTCDFEWTIGYSVHPAIASRNTEYQQHAITWNKEAAQDICATLYKR